MFLFTIAIGNGEPVISRLIFLEILRLTKHKGLNTATIPSWQAECSKPHNRGLLLCIEASTIAFGTVIAYWIVRSILVPSDFNCCQNQFTVTYANV